MSISAASRWSARRRLQVPMRASPRAAFPCSNRAARSATPVLKSGKSFLTRQQIGWASIAARSRSRMAPSRVRAMCGPAIGNSPTKSRWIAKRRRAPCQNHRHSGRWPEIRFSGWIFPTRFLRIHVSFMTRRWRECCMAGCCDPNCQLQNSSALRRMARAASPAWSRLCATAILWVSSAKPRIAPRLP